MLSLDAEAPFAVWLRFVSCRGLFVLCGKAGHHVLHHGIGGRLGKRGHRRVHCKRGMRRGEFMRHFPHWLVGSVLPSHWELAVRRLCEPRSRNVPGFLLVYKADGRTFRFPCGKQLYAGNVTNGFRPAGREFYLYRLVFCQLQFHDKTYFSKLCATRACRL